MHWKSEIESQMLKADRSWFQEAPIPACNKLLTSLYHGKKKYRQEREFSIQLNAIHLKFWDSLSSIFSMC